MPYSLYATTSYSLNVTIAVHSMSLPPLHSMSLQLFTQCSFPFFFKHHCAASYRKHYTWRRNNKLICPCGRRPTCQDVSGFSACCSRQADLCIEFPPLPPATATSARVGRGGNYSFFYFFTITLQFSSLPSAPLTLTTLRPELRRRELILTLFSPAATLVE